MEYIKYAFTGINIIPSVMLLVMIFYWIMTIFGFMAMDIGHKLDIDLDGDIDSTGECSYHHHNGAEHPIAETLASSSLPLKVLKFLNIGAIPLTIYLTLLILILWVFQMLTYYMEIPPDSFIGIIFFILFVMASFLLTKIITEPFKKLFLMMNEREDIEILGEVCELKHEADEKSLGQAILIKGKHDILINVISSDGKLKRGEKVHVIKKSEDDNVYIVQRVEDGEKE